jgi:hypothetical protein
MSFVSNVTATALYVDVYDVSTFESRTNFCKNRVILHHERSPLITYVAARCSTELLPGTQVKSDMHD